MSLTNQVFPYINPRMYYVFKIIRDPEEFNKAVEQSRPVVLMFSEERNELCELMKKPFRDLALAQKNRAVFCRVDIYTDKLKNKNIAELYRVEALPTFVLMKNGSEKKRVVGAKLDELKAIANYI